MAHPVLETEDAPDAATIPFPADTDTCGDVLWSGSLDLPAGLSPGTYTWTLHDDPDRPGEPIVVFRPVATQDESTEPSAAHAAARR